MLRRLYAALFALLIFIQPALAADDDIVRLFTFSPGTTIQSSQMNQEFNQLINSMNGKMSRSGVNTVSGANTFSGNNTFSGTNSFIHATSPLKLDKIGEYTSAAGVTVDSVLLKDGMVTVAGTAASNGTIGYASNQFQGYRNGTLKNFLMTGDGALVGAVTARSSNTILALADQATLFVYTSTFTQTFTAAATLGSTWYASVRNDGTGIITLDPNASETIDGSTTINVYPGEAFTLVCDGTNFKTVGRQKGMVLLATGTASASATLDFSAGLADAEFSSYIVQVENLVPATDGVNLWLRVSTDNGSSYLAGTNYEWGTRRFRPSDGGNGFDWSASDSEIELASATAGYLVGNASGEGISGTVEFKNPTSTSTRHTFEVMMNPIDISTGSYNVVGLGTYKATTAITNIRFMFSSGNITSGKVKLYGVRG